jgi:hypothetical protein
VKFLLDVNALLASVWGHTRAMLRRSPGSRTNPSFSAR